MLPAPPEGAGTAAGTAAGTEAGTEAGTAAWERIEQVTVPATVAWGDLDAPFLIEQCEQLAARLPASRRRVIPGTAHLPYLEQPERVAAVVREAVQP